MKQLLIIPCLFAALTAQAVMSLGPWVPLFKGVDHAIGTNALPDATFPRRQSVNFLRVDLQDPDVQLLHTPPAPGPIPESRETLSMTTSNFLKGNNLQVAVNANFFCCPEHNSEGLNAEVEGLAISRGTVVSSQEGRRAPRSFFSPPTNRPPSSTRTGRPRTPPGFTRRSPAFIRWSLAASISARTSPIFQASPSTFTIPSPAPPTASPRTGATST